MRQFLVNRISGKLWPLMPRRARLWAFMNDALTDGEYIEDADDLQIEDFLPTWKE